MKSLLVPVIVLVLLYTGFLGNWASSGSQLPPKVATHFNAHGVPNGWMSRSGNQNFTLAFGLLFPLFIVAVSYATRFLPPFLVNIPNRNYWLAPGRRIETANYLFRCSLWLACLSVCFVAGIQYSIVQANRQNPPHLSGWLIWAVVAPFIAGTIIYVLALIWHFRRGA